MPTTFTGDANASPIAPDDGLEPEATIDLELPLDGEAAAVASLQQAFRTIANHLTRLYRPQAKASDWAEPIQAWRTALGDRHFVIDHFGLPAGKVSHSREDFLINAYVPRGSPATPSDWHAVVTLAQGMPSWWLWHNTSGVTNGPFSFAPTPATADHPGGRVLSLVPGAAATSCVLRRFSTARFAPSIVVAMEWDAKAEAGCSSFMGLADEDAAIVPNLFSPSGIGFRKFEGAANWRVWSSPKSAVTSDDSGGPPVRFVAIARSLWKSDSNVP